MAEVHYSPGIQLTTGALDSAHKLITRKKHLHGPNGMLTKECKTEMYIQGNKRNYAQNPPRGNELAHLQHFGLAAKRTTELIYAYAIALSIVLLTLFNRPCGSVICCIRFL